MGFTFGDNWLRFSKVLTDRHVVEAEQSLQRLVGSATLAGRSFVDVGAGSGLFSIAAARAGASPVVAIDRDEGCLAAIRQNVARFLPPGQVDLIQVRRGDVLQPETLGDSTFDVVYAWGSLHHTGAMWQAIANASRLCRSGGTFVLAIYNRTPTSPMWLQVKRLYHAVPVPVEVAMAGALAAGRSGVRVLKGKHPVRTERGMNVWHDAVDWLGGLPYEYASAAEVIEGVARLGFAPVRDNLTARSGCNEFAFQKRPA